MSLEKGYSPEKELEQKDMLEKALQILSDEESSVLRLRFYERLTQEEVAKELGLRDREKARQLEAKALRALRSNPGIRQDLLETYLRALNK